MTVKVHRMIVSIRASDEPVVCRPIRKDDSRSFVGGVTVVQSWITYELVIGWAGVEDAEQGG